MYLLIAFLNINNSFTLTSTIGLMFLLVSLLCFFGIKWIKKSEATRNIAVLASLKNKLFQPEECLELYRWKKGKYIGFDDKDETILALYLYTKDTLIKAIDFNSWSGYECKGNIVTFKIYDIKFPTFVMGFRSEGEAWTFVTN
ncbi:hypothetical protein DOQ87_26225 [Salmonella enterica subsp. enterica serovar Benin]|nr:hypothetical protein [Salmonella enterica subsp. enterica serovar Benin]EBW4219587.1 hypothetical protein [Salmonella enterica subsp. enterica serovar Benin]ECB2072095.1 hypothetical protein [Salmonella enterica subsp. enterica serovar Benin]ECE9228671.1 hypothetical protein [Salmonella enterica subsp. enterica serovar Benin]OZU09758.1 hypothetical protein CCO48_26065 [Salmonella enterica subsp. enterica serovar Altendorf]